MQNKKFEKGSIMLEVIAVLALMGVMGAMLFRQIYQRNQELHNIQMASEIRTVKEAFSACLKARASDIQNACTVPAAGSTDVAYCSSQYNFQSCIKEYLPDGWFGTTSAPELSEYYYFTAGIYRQNDETHNVHMYGVLIPKESTIPSTGWNFKRAARIALLIGGDGGVFYEGVSGEDINGSLGTWTLDASPIRGVLENDSLPAGDNDVNKARYVAITGLDVFTPEMEKQEVTVNIPDQWSLQAKDLGAYGKFTVAPETACLAEANIVHTGTDGNGKVGSDGIIEASDDCIPTFWVDNAADGSGNVFVRNDLNVGMQTATGTSKIRLTDKGIIVFGSTVPDPQNSDKNINYTLDPAYTSVMNDVKLMSRGGAKLSEILPNYILKTVEQISGSSNFNLPKCPTNYKAAALITPVAWDASKSTSISFKNTETGKGMSEFPADSSKADLSKLDADIKDNLCIELSGTAATSFVKDNENPSTATATASITYKLGYKNASSTCVADSSVKAVVQTFCVFKDTNFTGKLPDTSIRPDLPKTNTEAECKQLGGTTWDSTTKACT